MLVCTENDGWIRTSIPRILIIGGRLQVRSTGQISGFYRFVKLPDLLLLKLFIALFILMHCYYCYCQLEILFRYKLDKMAVYQELNSHGSYHFQASKLKARSKSYTRLDTSPVTTTTKNNDGTSENKLKSKSTSTITEIYRQHGSFRILESGTQGGMQGEAQDPQVLVTKKGVVVPSMNYWLQKPDKPTIPKSGLFLCFII